MFEHYIICVDFTIYLFFICVFQLYVWYNHIDIIAGLLITYIQKYYNMEPGPQPLAPGPYVLLAIMTFLENKSMLLILLVHCFCECSCFEINSMTENFNSVLLFSGENLLMSAELEGCVTWFIYFCIFFRYGSYSFPKFHHCGICVTDFREEGLFAPHHQPRKGPSWIVLAKSCKKVMEFFSSKVAGYNLTKKGLHQRFFPVKFAKLFRAVFNQGNFWQMILYVLGLYEILPVFSTQWQLIFLRLHNDNCPCGTVSKQWLFGGLLNK